MRRFGFILFSCFFLFHIFCEAKENSIDESNLYALNQNKTFSKDEVLADEITALIFTSDPKLIDEEYLQDYTGIEIESLCIDKVCKFRDYFSNFLKKPLTLKTLEQIRNSTLNYFKENTPYLVDVKILENQDVSSGKVQILVIFAKLGEITASGGKYFSNERLLKRLNVKHNELINVQKTKKYLASFNQNPFRNVSILLEPGEEIGETNIHLLTEDIFPVKVFAGYENTGNEIASSNRFFTGLNFGNFLNLDHQMNLEFKFAPSIKKWWGLTGNYIIPAYYSSYLKVMGSYVRTTPESDENYNMKGKAWTVMGRYHVPLQLYKDGSNEFIFGYDFKQTNNFLTFLGSSIFSNYIDVSQFVFQFSGNASDRLGLTSYLLSCYFSPGKMTKHNDNSDFKQEGYAKSATYFYATLFFDRTFMIPKDFLYVLDFFAQVSTNKLLPTEQISIGGFYTVRGYQENAVFGDLGFYMRNEIRLPKVTFNKYKNITQELQFLAFIDVGYVTDVNDNVSMKNSSTLASIGPGVRYSAQNYVIFKLDYGIQLKKANRDYFAKSWHSKLHAYVSFQY